MDILLQELRLIKTPLRPSFEYLIKSLEPLLTIRNVYRLEDKDGFGPYGTKGWQTTPHSPSNGRPTPNRDEGFQSLFSKEIGHCWFEHLKIKSPSPVLFGFSSLTQLESWFYNKEELLSLYDLGFEIKIYQNASCYDSGKQVVFLKGESHGSSIRGK